MLKLDSSLCLCIDYYRLNSMLDKDYYLLLLTKETLNSLKGIRYFSKINIIAAFNNIRIKKGLKYLTAF
jgi:hypothetical protein